MEAIYINNYKNIQALELDSLSKINLFVGNNNVGKSTLLEALYLLTSDGNMAAIQEVLDIRGELYNPYVSDIDIEKQIESFTSLISQRDFQLFLSDGISMGASEDGIEKHLNFKIAGYVEYQEEDINESPKRKLISYIDIPEYQPIVEYGFLVHILNNLERQQKFYPFNRKIRHPLRGQKPIATQFVKTSQMTKDENASLYDKIALTKSEKEIISALNIIDPDIEGFNFLMDEYKIDSRTPRDRLNQQRVPYIIYKNSNERVRLSSMGDGINRILTIVLALLNAKDGYLLIDEFDSGLHYSVQTKLWEIIYSLAEEHNIQVFATTHSNDCIRSFVEADKNNNGKLIRLEEIEGEVAAIPFDNKERLRLAVEQNVEIR